MFRHTRYRIWLYFWAKQRGVKGHPEVSVHRRYEFQVKFVDLYWSITNKHTGHKHSYYDRMSFHNIIQRVKHEERRILGEYFAAR